MTGKGSKGFTLMEMLVVVAIIALLVIIAIPAMISSLEKVREATDLSNLRSAGAEVCSAYLYLDYPEGDKIEKKTDATGTYLVKNVPATQTIDKWQSKNDADTIPLLSTDVPCSTTGWVVKYYIDGNQSFFYSVEEMSP